MHPRNLPCRNRQQHPREEGEEGEEGEEDDKKGELYDVVGFWDGLFIPRAFQSNSVAVFCDCHVKFERPLLPRFRESAFSSGTLTNCNQILKKLRI